MRCAWSFQYHFDTVVAFIVALLVLSDALIFRLMNFVLIGLSVEDISSFFKLLNFLNAVLMRRQSCVEAYAEDAQAPASSFGSEKEGSLSKA